MKRTCMAVLSAALFSLTAQAAESVNIANWSGYIADDTLAEFARRTGIQPTYDLIDSNETTEAKLMTGGSGYDLVSPSNHFLPRLIKAGAIQALDRSKLPNWNNLDPKLMQLLQASDPGNRHAIPYMWVTTGIGYNVDKIKAIFGDTAVTGSWDVVFKPENAAKLKDCGITVLDTPSELIPIALNYLGEDPHSFDPAVIDKAAALLKSIRPYIRNFHSSSYINDLANGDVCLVVGWSGDIIQARDRAAESGNGVNVAYSIPKEGAPQWFDMLAIPKDAKNVDNAYAFINYLLDPKVAAANTNYVTYPNPVPGSKPLVDKSIADDPTIYPPADVDAKLFTFAVLPPDVDRQYTRIWTELKTGR